MKKINKYLLLIISISTYAQTEIKETNYEYDNLNRLVKVIFHDEAEKNYIYDDLGNRTQLNISTLSIDSETLKNTITVYPNPTSQFLNIKLPERLKSKELFFKLYDINGKQIKYTKYNLDDNRMEIDVSSLSNGVYLIHLYDGQEKWSQLFIKK